MADSTASGAETGGKGEAELSKMDAGDVPVAKDYAFGDIVTLNVGGKRWGLVPQLACSSSPSVCTCWAPFPAAITQFVRVEYCAAL